MANEDPTISQLTGSVSEAGARFFRGQGELIGWLSLTSRLAESLDGIARIVSPDDDEAEGDGEGETGDHDEESGEPRGALHAMRQYAPLLAEMALCRCVDNYLAYLAELLATIFRDRPETLKSGEQVPLDVVLEYDSIDDLIEFLAERRVDRLSYSGLTDLDDYLKDRLGFELFRKDDDRSGAVCAVERRNVIVHKRGIADARYLERSGDSDARRGRRIEVTGDMVVRTMDLLNRLVKETDDRASGKWGITQPLAAQDSFRIGPSGDDEVTDGARNRTTTTDTRPGGAA